MIAYRLVKEEFKGINMDILHGVIQADKHELSRTDTGGHEISFYINDNCIGYIECMKIEYVNDKTFNIYLG